MIEKNVKIYLAGHSGMVGSALLARLQREGYTNILVRTSQELNLLDQHATEVFLLKEKPEIVILAAAKVGGIHANMTYSADFIYINLQIEANVIHFASKAGVQRLLFFGGSCMFPKSALNPISEEALLTGPVEETNEAYALAKIAGFGLCAAYKKQYGLDSVCIVPTNLYGPHDTFDPLHSHLIPALLQKFHDAKKNNQKQVTLWGSGQPLRDFLYVEDLVDACIFLLHHKELPLLINVGSGYDMPVREIAHVVKNAVRFEGEILWDPTKPDGIKRKLLDTKKITALGWKPKTPLQDGVQKTYQWFLMHHS